MDFLLSEFPQLFSSNCRTLNANRLDEKHNLGDEKLNESIQMRCRSTARWGSILFRVSDN